jgi:hypothetical protein
VKRFSLPFVALLATSIAFVFVPAAGAIHAAEVSTEPFCETHSGFCPDTRTRRNYEGQYVGHDEPSLLFYSNRPGSGNSNDWRLRLPVDASTLPTQDGRGGTWNFQQHVAFWFGMDLCESQSYPNPGAPCTPDSDSNIRDGTDPAKPDYIGNHAGSGFLELQFYPPGWVAPGISCDARTWCAAMVVFGLSDSQAQTNNADCLSRAGEEWSDFAFLTKDGSPQAPPDPLGATDATFTPDPTQTLFMNAGDDLTISIHDSRAGFVTEVTDLTTGAHGSMTASAQNGFAHPMFQPNASKCSEQRYGFHPMYSTSSEHTRVPWAAHSYNVSFSDEIGHFEYCGKVDVNGLCTEPGATDKKLDGDDDQCYDASASSLVAVTGCTDSDVDFDGTSYQADWPGTLRDSKRDAQLHGQSFLVTSPQTAGHDYERMAFEADMPGIESGCPPEGGAGCVNPPPGAAFYPIYSTQASGKDCAWQEGGTFIPGTTNTFGGTSTAEYGSELFLYYAAEPGFPAGSVLEDYRNVLASNPCANSGKLPR